MSIVLIRAMFLRRAAWRAWDTNDAVGLQQLLRVEAIVISMLIGWDVACYMAWRSRCEDERAAARVRCGERAS